MDLNTRSASPQSYQYFLRQNGQRMLDEVQQALGSQQQTQAQQQPQQVHSILSNVAPQLGPSQTDTPSAQPSGLLQAQQPTILGAAGPITEHFGDMQAIEHYSHGFTAGVGIGVPDGTPVALPPGQWQIVQSFDKATSGGQNDPQRGINSGYGNSVLAENTQTGEKLRFSHLSANAAHVGDQLPGGTVFGLTGHTGNTTGPHLNLEYYDAKGTLADPLKSPYARFLNLAASSPQNKGKGGGNPILGALQAAWKGYTENPQQAAGAPMDSVESYANAFANSNPLGQDSSLLLRGIGSVAGPMMAGLTRLAPAAAEDAPTLNRIVAPGVKQIGIDSLISHEGAPDLARVAQYKQAIQQGQPIAPLITIKEGPTSYGVEDGKHRLEAMRQLGIGVIPTVEKSAMTPAVVAGIRKAMAQAMGGAALTNQP